MKNKIIVRYSLDGRLPPGVVLCRIYEPGPGWYAITPNGVAHRQHCWHCAMKLIRNWLSNFRNNPRFWHNDRRGLYGS